MPALRGLVDDERHPMWVRLFLWVAVLLAAAITVFIAGLLVLDLPI